MKFLARKYVLGRIRGDETVIFLVIYSCLVTTGVGFHCDMVTESTSRQIGKGPIEMQMFVNALETSFVAERLIDPRIISSTGIAATPLASLPAVTVNESPACKTIHSRAASLLPARFLTNGIGGNAMQRPLSVHLLYGENREAIWVRFAATSSLVCQRVFRMACGPFFLPHFIR